MVGRARLTGKCREFQQIEISANTADGYDKNLSIIYDYAIYNDSKIHDEKIVTGRYW